MDPGEAFLWVRAYLSRMPGVEPNALASMTPRTSVWRVAPSLNLAELVDFIEATFAVRVPAVNFHPECVATAERIESLVRRLGSDPASAPAVPGPAPEPPTPAARTSWLATGLLLVLLAVLLGLEAKGLRTTLGAHALGGLASGYGVLVVAAVVRLFAPARWRRPALVALGAVALPLLLGGWALAAAGYVGLVCWVARLGLRLRWQLVLVAAAWVSLPLARTFGGAQPSLLTLAWWIGTGYAAAYLLIDRRRGLEPVGRTVIDDVLYLTALPRLVEPFFQPLGYRQLSAAARARPSTRSLWRAFALGLYGAAMAYVARGRPEIELAHLPLPLHFAAEHLAGYARAVSQIFVSMSLFGLSGYPLRSGFHLPYASTSFADFFRRWNYYVRDWVLSLFFFPLLGTLRRVLPRRLGTYAAIYLAVFVGSYALNDLLVPTVMNPDPWIGASRSFNAPRMTTLFLLWTAIIFSRWGGPMPGGWRRLRANALFLAAFFGIGALSWLLGHRLVPAFGLY